ncbi:MAG: universal stress protein [Flavobacteriales bacterium]|nr:universal stress protein [Flavobacteriales bacterium]
MKNRILVPTDFTKVGETAINHALVMAGAVNGEVHVLHIIGNKREIVEAKLQLETLQATIKKERNIDVHTIVRIGSIFDDIDKVANEIGASLIIMGTHGLKGMQFITGSRALKIVTESSIPFIIVQERDIRTTGYDTIVVPLDLQKETKQKLKLVAKMATYFDAEVYLVSPGESDEFLRNQLDRNINYAKNFFKEKNIKYKVEITETKSGNFAKGMLKFAASVDADLVCIMNFYENSLMGILGGSYEQMVITNEAQIPVLCINPVETHVIDGSVFEQ